MSFEKLEKMSGYLEKRGKLNILGRWKKWWCVLEGQLLLYYKSRVDYTKLSPCCGSLNMALVRNVQPHIRCQIHIVTHTQLIILRTKNKEKQQQWFHALVGVLPQNSYLSPIFYFPINPIESKRKRERKTKKIKLKTTEYRDVIDQTTNQETSSHGTDAPIEENNVHEDIFVKCKNEISTKTQNISIINESKKSHIQAENKNTVDICESDIRPSIDSSNKDDDLQESCSNNDILDVFVGEIGNINSSKNKIERKISIDHSIKEEGIITSNRSGGSIGKLQLQPLEIGTDSSTGEQFNNNSKSPIADEKLVDNEMYSSEVCLDLDYSISEYHEQNSNNEIFATEIIRTEPNLDLDSLLLQLTSLNHNEQEKLLPSLEFANNGIEDSDYDIPIPHHSLAQKNLNQDYLEQSSVNSTSNIYTDSFSLDMAPDSLEMPWMINSTPDANLCSNKHELSLGLDNDSDSDYGYHDSLNSSKYYT